MRRRLGWLAVALVLVAGGLAGCGDDDDGDGGGGGDATTTEASGSGGGGGNEAITSYCDKVQELVDKGEELRSDPTNSDLQGEIEELSTELASEAADLAAEAPSFDADDAAQFQECQTQFSTAGG